MSVPFFDLSRMHAELQPELDEVWARATRGNAYIGGAEVDAFEAKWAAYCESAHCVGLSSGTAALELSLRALGIGRGDEVVVPASTFIATAAAVVAVGAAPVFADVDPETLLLTGAELQAAITPATAAVIVVHLYGQPADMDAIGEVAQAAGIAVIEDAAQAQGASWRGRPAGGLSTIGCFSFYPGKNLGAFGDAGAVVTNDRGLAERMRSLSNHGRCRSDPYEHDMLGHNHRLDAIQAGVLSVKLGKLDDWNAQRGRVASKYAQALGGLPVELVAQADGACSSHHLAVIRTRRRTELRKRLAEAGIGTGIHYPIACHRQAPFAGAATRPLPVAERAAEEVLSLPMFPHMTDRQVGEVASAIERALGALERQSLQVVA